MTPSEPDPRSSEISKHLEAITQGLVQVGELKERVSALDKHVTISENASIAAEKASTRSGKAMSAAIFVSALALIAAGLSFYSLRAGCLSANGSRSASESIWTVVLHANDGHQSAREKRQSALFADYITRVYAPHDCWNLLKTYPTPAPPDLNQQ